MLWEGINLMLIGMGTVFLFLTLLVFCVQIMSRLIGRYFPEAAPVPAPAPAPDRRQEEVLAAVSAAVHHHRQRH